MIDTTEELAPSATFPSERHEGDFTDAELTLLALSADPDQAVDPNAVPMPDPAGVRYGSLPSWYMPPLMSSRRTPLRTAVILTIVVSLLLIEALGLCVTFGQLVMA